MALAAGRAPVWVVGVVMALAAGWAPVAAVLAAGAVVLELVMPEDCNNYTNSRIRQGKTW